MDLEKNIIQKIDMLIKSRNNGDRKFLGVCIWLAIKFDIDVGGLRILFIVDNFRFWFTNNNIFYFVFTKTKSKLNEGFSYCSNGLLGQKLVQKLNMIYQFF